MGVTRDLASFAAEIAFEDIPEDVVDVAKVSTLNIPATCLGGYRTRIGRLHVELAHELGGGTPQATIVGDGSLVSVPAAAYANANLAFALDYEDMLYLVVHAGYATVAAALAVGEYVGARGRDCLAAIVAGYEVSGRIGVAVQPTPERGSEVWGEMFPSFAAAVTAGRLLELDADEMDVALGIAGTYAPLPSTHKYFGIVEETRPMREVKQGWGWMCMGGILAAMSAKRGFRGGHGFLDGRHGFWIMAGSDRCEFGRIAAGLGRTWVTRDTVYKLHPSIGTNHPVFWATKSLVDEHGLRAEDVERVRVTTLWGDRIGDTEPTSEVDAQFCFLTRSRRRSSGSPSVRSSTRRRRWPIPALRRLLKCTEVVHNPEADRAFFEEQRVVQSIELELANGRRLSRDVEFPRDAPPYGRPEIERKFEHLAAGVLDERRQAKVRTAIDELEQLGNVTELMAAFR